MKKQHTMNKNIQELAPQTLWKYFADICRIPHPSHHEQAIHDYLVAQAAALGLSCTTDEAGNVILRKAATPGMENLKGVILQAHMDMVPQKNGDKKFDFTTDSIEAYVDGDWVTADGTTLGADNGIGMAAILAVMASPDLQHGPLEALITCSEEVGMDGAFGLKPGLLQGEILINLDSETEGELYVGCAGGQDVSVTFTYKEEPVPADSRAYRLELKGLKGGHSGMEIILERGNANKIMNRFLLEAQDQYGLRLASIDGGGLRNAIPRESVAVVTLPAVKAEAFEAAVASFERLMQAELKGVDDGVNFRAVAVDVPTSLIDADTQDRLLKSVAVCPNGIIRMSPAIAGLVQTSTNLARVVSAEGTIQLHCMMRSSVDSEKDALADSMKALFSLAGAQTELSGAYSGWNPDPSSAILKTMLAEYKALYGREPEVKAIHAGLECGILGGTYPGLDMISMGPTIQYPHSPDEKVNVSSVGRFWDFLCHVLAHIPTK